MSIVTSGMPHTEIVGYAPSTATPTRTLASPAKAPASPAKAPADVAQAPADLGKAPAKTPAKTSGEPSPAPLHRVSEVRAQQGVSLRTAARHMGQDMATIRKQEDPTSDLRISELIAWQKVLDVPLIDLLVDSAAPLSRPVMERAQLVRLMKTAAAIQEKTASMPERGEALELQRLSSTLIEQLVQIMPELAEVSAWHSVGQRRSLDEVGRVAERRIRDDFFVAYREE